MLTWWDIMLDVVDTACGVRFSQVSKFYRRRFGFSGQCISLLYLCLLLFYA